MKSEEVAAALAKVEQMRHEAMKRDGGCTVLRAVRFCFERELPPPKWLATRYIELHDKVERRYVLSWDGVFGKPWEPKTKRVQDPGPIEERARRVHAEVLRITTADPSKPIDRGLFEEVVKHPGLHCAVSTAQFAYYEIALKRLFLDSASARRVIAPKRRRQV